MMRFMQISGKVRPLGMAGLLLLSSAAAYATQVPPASPAALSDKQAVPAAPSGVPSVAKPDGVNRRFDIDRRIKKLQQEKAANNWAVAQAGMLEAASDLGKLGYPADQLATLREMTLETVDDKPDGAQAYVLAARSALAEHYYREYLGSKPRDAKWLLEALGWANYAQNTELLKRFTARAPDKAHENIDKRGVQRGAELAIDDALFLTFEEMRKNKPGVFTASLQEWPYPINIRHTQVGASLLHMAVWYNKPEIVKLLVEKKKAEVNVVDYENDTPLDYAQHKKLDAIASYLKSKGATANNKPASKPAAGTGAPLKPAAPAAKVLPKP
jgi:hypothetical protein